MTSIWDNILNIAGTDPKPQNVKEKPLGNQKTQKKDIRVDCNKCDIVLSRQGISMGMYLLQDLNLHNKIIKKFTVNIPTISGYTVKVSNHITDTNNMKYVFPRFGFIDYIEENFKNYNFINKIGSGKRPSVPFKWTGAFSNNQPIIAKHIMENYFTNENAIAGKAGLILNLTAGQGKTFLATGLIEKIQRKTLVICHNKTILHQWIKVLKGAYPSNIIAHFYGEKKEEGDVVVGVINSLLIQPKDYFYQFGYVILDEVHEYVSKTRKKIYSLASSTYILGLSATPNERADGLDKVNIWNCGSILNAKDIECYTEDDIPFKGEVTMLKYIAPKEYTKVITNKSLEIVSFSEMVSQMCADPYRIHLIVKTIYELRQKNMQVLVFADRRSYLEEIRKELDRFHIINDILDDIKIDAKRVVGGAKAHEIEYAEIHSNVILSTYQFFGTGKSIPKLDAVVLCSPRKGKSKQFIGRIFRLGSDYSIVRQIIDIVDFGSVLKSSWYKRKKFYNEMKYPIEEVKIKYEELEEEMLEMGILVENDDDGVEIDVVDKSLKELEALLGKYKILVLDMDELELLYENSDGEDDDIDDGEN
jgi:superfamily II DNA or RNA helicase